MHILILIHTTLRTQGCGSLMNFGKAEPRNKSHVCTRYACVLCVHVAEEARSRKHIGLANAGRRARSDTYETPPPEDEYTNPDNAITKEGVAAKKEKEICSSPEQHCLMSSLTLCLLQNVFIQQNVECIQY